MASTHRMFIGTYTKAGSKGIYAVSLDGATGVLSEPQLAAEAPNPTYIALSPDKALLYAVRADAGWASSFKVSADRTKLTTIQQGELSTGPTPCHISVDDAGAIALAANYHLGMAAAIPLGGDGTMGKPRVVAHEGKGPHPTRQTTSHVHSTYFTPDGRFAVICDLGLDRVYTYGIDRENVTLVAGSPPFVTTEPASGPRHRASGRRCRCSRRASLGKPRRPRSASTPRESLPTGRPGARTPSPSSRSIRRPGIFLRSSSFPAAERGRGASPFRATASGSSARTRTQARSARLRSTPRRAGSGASKARWPSRCPSASSSRTDPYGVARTASIAPRTPDWLKGFSSSTWAPKFLAILRYESRAM